MSAHCLGGQGTGTAALAIKLLQQRQQTRLKQIVLFILVVIGTKVLKQETELLPTASKKLTQPPKLAYQTSHKFWTFLQFNRPQYPLKSLWNHFRLIFTDAAEPAVHGPHLPSSPECRRHRPHRHGLQEHCPACL